MALRQLVLTPILLCALAAPARALTVTTVGPADGAMVGNTLYVIATISTPYDFTATATVGTQTLPMVNTGTWFQAVFYLYSLPDGPVAVALDVSDTSGAAQHIERTVDHQPIHLTIDHPEFWEVARSTVHFTGTCSVNGGPCPRIAINAHWSSAPNAPSMYHELHDVSSFDELIDLSAFDGAGIETDLYWLDIIPSAAWTTEQHYFQGNVEASPHLQPFVQVPGYIVDFDGTRVLYLQHAFYGGGGSGNLNLFHMDTGVDEYLGPGSGSPNFYSLTPQGAVWMEGAVMRESRAGVLIQYPATFRVTQVAGDFALLFANLPNPMVGRLNLVDDSYFFVGASNGYVGALGSNGAIFYASTGPGLAFWSETTGTVTFGDFARPRTDGTLVTFDDDPTNASYFGRPDGTFEELVAASAACFAGAQPFGGAVGYVRKNTNGVCQAWVRGTDGSSTQISTYLDDGIIDANFESGSATVLRPDGMEILSYDGSTRPVAAHRVRMVYRGAQWYALEAGTVCVVQDAPPPPEPDAGVPDAMPVLDATPVLDAMPRDAAADDAAISDGPGGPDAAGGAGADGGQGGCGCRSTDSGGGEFLFAAAIALAHRRRRLS